MSVPSGAFDGYVWVRVVSQDLAGNYLQNNDPTSLEFDGVDDTDDNFLYLDNTQPTATLTYTNLRDSSLTIFNADNESESYCCFAIAGDSVLIKVEMNEAGDVEIVDPKTGQVRYDEQGEHLNVSQLVEEFLTANPHFVAATPSGAGTTSKVGDAGSSEKFDITKLDMSKAEDRKIYSDYRKQKGMSR